MKVLITGVGGQLGDQLQRNLEKYHEVVGFTHDELDITNPRGLRQSVDRAQPDIIINAAAYTNVDSAENDPHRAFSTNASGPGFLVNEASRTNSRVIHLSTDYVFGGTNESPYTVEDCPDPQNVYGTSKLAGEHLVLNYARGTVLRTSGVYGGKPGQHNNFISTLVRLSDSQNELTIVDDQVLSPTWTVPLAETISAILNKDAPGLYHYAASGECSWYDFAREAVDLLNLDVTVRPITSDELNREAPRPSYSALKTSPDIVAEPPDSWKQMLEDYCTNNEVKSP